MSALISDCGKYRYTLTRKIPSILRWVRPVLFIMLNPSTADAEKDDPTIRRCIGFCTRENWTDLTVVNLYALRATNPKELWTSEDPIGPWNNLILAEQIHKHRNGTIIAAWGAQPKAKMRAAEVRMKWGPFQCFGITNENHPRHPLYLKSDASLIELRATL